MVNNSMARERPVYIDLNGVNSRASSRGSSRNSPRIHHFEGDIPPSLSPLDALAAHSRKLAKELEDTRLAGERRLSRLPPLLVQESLMEHHNSKPSIFKALSEGSEPSSPVPAPATLHSKIPQLKHDAPGLSPEIKEPKNRPLSTYPRISAIMKLEDRPESQIYYTPRESYVETTQLDHIPESYFDVPTFESPRQTEPPNSIARPMSQQSSSLSNTEWVATLAPPNAAFARLKSRQESSDDDYTSSAAGSTFSRPRKLSSSSGASIPQSPVSARVQHVERPPSTTSIRSSESKTMPQRMNFSRPMSAQGMTSGFRQDLGRRASRASHRSQASTLSNSPALPTSPRSVEVRSVTTEGFVSGEASYTHATYQLPRGRMADRTSAVFLALSTPHFEWQEPMFPATPTSEFYELPSPGLGLVQTKQSNEQMPDTSGFAFGFETVNPVVEEEQPEVAVSASIPVHAVSDDGHQPGLETASLPLAPPIPDTPMNERTRSEHSASTVRPTTARTNTDYQALSADEHVSKAIELHQHGDLKESTYHLRIAAKQDHATGMLLYALACRHGWGMRPNQSEGVKWLRKAVDIAMLEIADDEDPSSDKPRPDYNEKKAHRAQFALSIYELGVSHLNGWGIEQDKALALRCFEIAGNWGDTDALSEAGFCHAEGIGCKKDMKKAAKFYRMAEARGVSMIGNSWIHKDKYKDDDDNDRKSRSSKKTTTEKPPRNKSRTRSIFMRRKTITT